MSVHQLSSLYSRTFQMEKSKGLARDHCYMVSAPWTPGAMDPSSTAELIVHMFQHSPHTEVSHLGRIWNKLLHLVHPTKPFLPHPYMDTSQPKFGLGLSCGLLAGNLIQQAAYHLEQYVPMWSRRTHRGVFPTGLWFCFGPLFSCCIPVPCFRVGMLTVYHCIWKIPVGQWSRNINPLLRELRRGP